VDATTVISFAKYHGLGNDYLVVDAAAAALMTPPAVRRICDRHLGVGADGILVWSRAPELHVRIFNPDGSEAEKSGNGLRILARHLFDQGVVSGEPFRVATAGGPVECRVDDGGRSVSVEMGHVSFRSADIPVTGPPREVLDEELTAGGTTLRFSAATLGNPHCVIFRDVVSEAEARALGPLVERDLRFPNRTNVQFVQVLDAANLRIEIWERGAGHTLASGSSGSAAAAVAHRLGRCGRAVMVHMPGGALTVEIHDDFAVRLRGPVVKVADGRIDAECLDGAA
jgi:diaminopimelate epimerase